MENNTSYVYPTPVNPLDKFLGIFASFGSIFGVIAAYFGGDVNGERSEYLRFYCNQSLIFCLAYLLSFIPILGQIWDVFVLVCQIIAIINACKGIAKPVLFFGTIRLIK